MEIDPFTYLWRWAAVRFIAWRTRLPVDARLHQGEYMALGIARARLLGIETKFSAKMIARAWAAHDELLETWLGPVEVGDVAA